MQTHTYVTYSFDELSEEAQEYALEKYWQWDVDDTFWQECVIDDAKEIGKILGIEIENIYFSGFSSQGDGACFEGYYSYAKQAPKNIKAYAPEETKLHTIAQNLQDLQRKNFYCLSANVKHRGHYYHEMCTDIQVWNDNESMGGANDEAHDGIKELLRDFMRWIYRTLEKEFEYRTSAENLKESFQANDVQFLENGNLP